MTIDKKYRVPRIVAAHERSPVWLRIVLLLLLISAAAWYGYRLGSTDLPHGIPGFKPTAEKRIHTLEEERDELRRELKKALQEARVDQESLRSIRERIKQFQDERMEMEEELAFLRGIVSTGSGESGLRIQKFKLEPGLEEYQYIYTFSVSQVINSGTVAKGRIHIRLEGLQDGKTVVFDLKEMTQDKLSSHKMRFRYFQNVDGKLKLPGDFEPAKLIIEVDPEGSKLNPLTSTFDWPL